MMPVHSTRAWIRFTLVELLVVVAIIAILASFLLPALAQARLQARRTQCGGQIRNLGLAALFYAEDYGQYVPIYLYDVPSTQWFPSWRQQLQVYTGPGRALFDCPMTGKPWNDSMGTNSGSIGVMYMMPYNYKGPHFNWPGLEVDYIGSRWVAWPLTPGRGWKDPPNSVYLADAYASDQPPMYPSLEWIGTNHIHPNTYPSYWTGSGGSRRFAERHLGTNVFFLDGHAEIRRAYDLDRMPVGDPGNIWDMY